MNEQLRRLASIHAGDLPFLSIYLDARPEGEDPRRRPGLIVLNDRLREIRKTFLPRGADLDSFEADAKRIERFIDEEMAPSSAGVAIFACDAEGVWETVEVATPFDNQVTVASRPDLYQLAKLDDEFETAVVGVLDSNTARLFVWQYGALVEAGGPDDDPVHYQRRDIGGWSQARYQRHIDKHYKDFAEEIVRAMGDLIEREDASRVVLAGDELTVGSVRSGMPAQLAEKVAGEFRADIRVNVNDITAQAGAILEEAERLEGMSAVEQAIAEIRQGDLGLGGLVASSEALERGQVDTLIIDESRVGPVERRELVRLATETAARVEVVQDADPMHEFEGVATILRYKY